MKGADREGIEALPAWPFAFGDGQAGDAVTLQASVQAGAGQLGNAGLQGAKDFAHGSFLAACRLSVSPHPGAKLYRFYTQI